MPETPLRASHATGDSPTRKFEVEIPREEFNRLKDQAVRYGVAWLDLARADVLTGIALRAGGEPVKPEQPKVLSSRWVPEIMTVLEDSNGRSTRDLAVMLGTTTITLRPILAALVSAGKLRSEVSREQPASGRPPTLYFPVEVSK
jgi:hypothetical protein